MKTFFKQLLLTIWRDRSCLVSTLFCAIVLGFSLLLELLVPIFLKLLVQQSTPERAQSRLFWMLALGYGLIWITSQLFLRIKGLLIQAAGSATTAAFMRRLLNQALHFPHRTLLPSPHHLNLFYREASQCAEFLLWYLPPIGFQLLFAFGIILKYTGLEIAAIFSATILIYFLLMLCFKKIYAQQEAAAAQSMRFSQKLFDGFSRLSLIHFFRAESAYQKSLESELDQAQKEQMRIYRNTEGLMGLQILFLGVGLLALLSVLTWKISLGELSAGDLMLIHSYFLQLTLPLAYFGYMISALQRASTTFNSILPLLVASAPSFDATQGLTFQRGDAPVLEMRNLSFELAGRKLLNNLNFSVRRGEFVVLTGSSGQGKTTLLNLVMKQLQPSSGQILLSAHALESLSSEILFDAISIAPQNVQIFNQTVIENLLLFQPFDPNRAAELNQVLKSVCLLDHIDRLPHGLQTFIDPEDPCFSRGELQRLTLARALLKPAEFYIFDEPTAALDLSTGSAVLNGILKHLEHKAFFMVTHQLSLMRKADQLLILRADGRLERLDRPADLKEENLEHLLLSNAALHAPIEA